MLKRLTIPLFLIMFSTGVHALTMGQIHVHSFINQPLKATIDLQDVKAGELAALKLKLASRTDFKNAGVDWSTQLESLRFSVIQSNKGPAIRVTSNKAVSEPFLSFVVDARWADGKMIKDYTLLLDPPLYSGKMAAPIDMADAAADAAIVPASQAVQSADSGQQQQDRAQPPATEAPRAARKAAPAMQTMAGTTLWQVASKVRPTNATMQQTMVAIHEENPESFIRGNMNLLKKDQLLRIPSAEAIRGTPASAANQRMAEHESALRSRRAVTPSKRLSPEIVAQAAEATESSAQAAEAAESPAQQQAATVTPPPGSDSGGRLRLDSAADDVSKETMSGDSAAGESDLAAGAVESEENKVLRSRVELLEDQLRAAHKLIKMKGELVQLQQLYRQINEQKAQAGSDQQIPADSGLLLLADDGDDAADKSAAEEEPGQEQSSGADDTRMKDDVMAAGAPEEQQKTAAADTDVDDASPEASAVQPSGAAAGGEDAAASDETPAEKEQTPAEKKETPAEKQEISAEKQETPAEKEETPVTLPAATPAEAGVEESAASAPEQQAASPAGRRDSLIEGIDDDLLFIASGVAVLGLLLSFLLGRLGRKGNRVGDAGLSDDSLVGESLAEKSRIDVSSEAGDEPVAEIVTQPVVTGETPAKQPQQESTTRFQTPGSLSVDEEEPQALDPLELATVLLGNGENRQAQDILRHAVEVDPTRMDLHMCLIESLYEEKDRHAFEAQMNQLESSGINIDPDEWLKIERMHADLLPAGVDTLGVVNKKHVQPEIIDLDTDTAEKSGDAGDSELVSDEDAVEGEGQSDSDLEEALRAFELELDDKRSEELLSEAGLALDETAEILNNPVTTAMPDAQIVQDLELAEDLDVEEHPETDQGAEVISLDDSFGIDSHISRDFDDVFTKSSVQRETQPDTLSASEVVTLPIEESEELSISSFDTDPSTLREAELDAKIDLAAAFADMGDVDGAKDILDEVMSDGSEQQQQSARELLKKYL